MVKVSLGLAPDEMRADGELYLQSCNGAAGKNLHHCATGALVVEVTKGIYNLGAHSATGKFAPSYLVNEWINPPLYDYTFKVAP